MDEILRDLGSVVQDWQTLGTLAGLIALVHLLTTASKLPFLDGYIKPSWRPWIAIGLGVLGGVVSALAAGKNLVQAIVSGVLVGLGAIGSHEAINAAKPTEAAKTNAGSVVAEAMAGANGEIRRKVADLHAAIDKAAAMPDQKTRLQELAKLADQ